MLDATFPPVPTEKRPRAILHTKTLLYRFDDFSMDPPKPRFLDLIVTRNGNFNPPPHKQTPSVDLTNLIDDDIEEVSDPDEQSKEVGKVDSDAKKPQEGDFIVDPDGPNIVSNFVFQD